jgi:hypothetical protein
MGGRYPICAPGSKRKTGQRTPGKYFREVESRFINMDKFKVVAPKGNHVAYREVIAPNGKPVLAIHTGAYLSRLGSLRESAVYALDEKGNPDYCLICEFGGVIRELRKWLNDKPNELGKLFSLEKEGWRILGEIKNRYP